MTLTLMGLELTVMGSVYEPAEDSLLLAKHLSLNGAERVLDMCTGSGFLGLLTAKCGAMVQAVDKNPQAVECANFNACQNGLADRFKARQGDLFSTVEGSFDLIIFNPPYLPTESEEGEDMVSAAWDGGPDGRSIIDGFLKAFTSYLDTGGRLLTIGSSLSDYPLTVEILEGQGFQVSLAESLKLGFEELVLIRADL